jgi:hypothetical protein
MRLLIGGHLFVGLAIASLAQAKIQCSSTTLAAFGGEAWRNKNAPLREIASRSARVARTRS